MTSTREQLLQQIGEQARLYLGYGETKDVGHSVQQYLTLITDEQNLTTIGIGTDRMDACELYALLLARITDAVHVSARNQSLSIPTRASKQDLGSFWAEAKKGYRGMHRHPYLKRL